MAAKQGHQMLTDALKSVGKPEPPALALQDKVDSVHPAIRDRVADDELSDEYDEDDVLASDPRQGSVQGETELDAYRQLLKDKSEFVTTLSTFVEHNLRVDPMASRQPSYGDVQKEVHKLLRQ